MMHYIWGSAVMASLMAAVLVFVVPPATAQQPGSGPAAAIQPYAASTRTGVIQEVNLSKGLVAINDREYVLPATLPARSSLRKGSPVEFRYSTVDNRPVIIEIRLLPSGSAVQTR